MSKYQKLDSAQAPTAHEDDYDESFSLYFDGNQTQSGAEQQLHDSRQPARGVSHLTNDSPKYQHHQHQHQLNNNNSLESSHRVAGIGSKAIRDLDEQTWEVPLLSGSEGSASNLHSEHEHDTAARMEFEMEMGADRECRSSQPGFGVNLKSKSAQEAKFKILLAISLCCIFMIIEFLGGYVAGSLAIMTDAAHLATDCISFVIGLVAIWLGTRPPDERMSFGYKRYEVIGALASILGIWLLTGILVVVAIQRIYSQDFQLDVNVMMFISGIGIAINIVMMFVLHGNWLGIGGHGHGHGHSHGHGHGHGHSHSHSNSDSNCNSGSYSLIAAGSESSLMTTPANEETRATIANGHNVAISNGSKPFERIVTGGRPKHEGKQMSPPQPLDMEENLNLRAAMIHVIGDLVQSIGVFLAAVLIKFCPGAKYADPLCTLLFSVIVILTTVPLFRESVGILLDAVPQNLSLRTLQRQLASIEGVRSVHHLNVWQHTAEHRVLMVHLVTEERSNSEDILRLATQLVSGPEYHMKHATIQIERLTA